MRLLALLATSLFAGAVMADDKKDEKKPKDEEAILGTWKVEKCDTGGVESAFAKAQSKSQLTFSKGGKLLWTYPVEDLEGEYQLDPDATSKLMKLSFGKGTVGAMYELDGDTLRIAFTFEGQAEWPKEVKADAKQKIGVISLKRVKDEEAILGTWQCVKYDDGSGKESPANEVAMRRFSFAKGGKLSVAVPFAKYEGEYLLDPTVSPKAVDMSRDGKTMLAAYALDGDTLTLAATSNKRTARPEELKADAKGVTVMTLKRVKDEKKSKDAEAIVGEWQVVKVDNGTAVSPLAEDLAKFSFTFSKDGKLALTGPDDEDQGEYKLDPTAKPKTLDMIRDGKTARVAYSLEGDTLTVAMRIGGGDKPPEELKADGKSVAVLTLKRVKKSKDAEAILGTWKTEKYDTGGLEDASAEFMSKARLTFSEGGKMLWVYPDVEQKAKYEMDPDAKPKTLTMYIEDGTVGAIYELDGDTLRIAFARTGQSERPKELKADGKTSMLMILKRVKDEKKEEKKDK